MVATVKGEGKHRLLRRLGGVAVNMLGLTCAVTLISYLVGEPANSWPMWIRWLAFGTVVTVAFLMEFSSLGLDKDEAADQES